MLKKTPVKILNDCIENGLAWTELHGYQWFKSTLLPAIKALEKAATSRRKLSYLANGFCLLGDLYFVLDAPVACLMAYKRALRLYPHDTELLGDISDVLFMLGRYEEAWRYHQRAISDDKKLKTKVAASFSGFKRDISGDRSVVSHKDSLLLACERLVHGQSMAALRLTEKRRGTYARRIRMMALGIIEDTDAVMLEFSHIAKTAGVLEWNSADWFFLPDTLWEDAKFWTTMLSMSSRFSNLGLHSPSSEIQGPPELLSNATKTLWPKIHRVAIEYHLARTNADSARLQKLCQKYPKWIDCSATLEYLQQTGKPPTRFFLLHAFNKVEKM